MSRSLIFRLETKLLWRQTPSRKKKAEYITSDNQPNLTPLGHFDYGLYPFYLDYIKIHRSSVKLCGHSSQTS